MRPSERIWETVADRHGLTAHGLRRKTKQAYWTKARAQAYVSLLAAGVQMHNIEKVSGRDRRDVMRSVLRHATYADLTALRAALGARLPKPLKDKLKSWPTP